MLYQLSYASECCFVAATLREPARAGDGARTRDIKLGRLALYQLSYSREGLSGRTASGGGRIRTFEGLRRQIYSLLPLATWVPHPNLDTPGRRCARRAPQS